MVDVCIDLKVVSSVDVPPPLVVVTSDVVGVDSDVVIETCWLVDVCNVVASSVVVL